MINWNSMKNELTKQPAHVLDRLANPDAPGNEAYRFLINWAMEISQKIRAKTDNLSVPVLDVELRQARGAQHILGAITETAEAAAAVKISTAARAAGKEPTQPTP